MSWLGREILRLKLSRARHACMANAWHVEQLTRAINRLVVNADGGARR